MLISCLFLLVRLSFENHLSFCHPVILSFISGCAFTNHFNANTTSVAINKDPHLHIQSHGLIR